MKWLNKAFNREIVERTGCPHEPEDRIIMTSMVSLGGGYITYNCKCNHCGETYMIRETITPNCQIIEFGGFPQLFW